MKSIRSIALAVGALFGSTRGAAPPVGITGSDLLQSPQNDA